jgi:ATP-dependent Clp protease ATP-binding subunit ClpA
VYFLSSSELKFMIERDSALHEREAEILVGSPQVIIVRLLSAFKYPLVCP